MKPAAQKESIHWADPLLLEQQLTGDERMVRDTAQAYCQEKLVLHVLEAFRHERMHATIFREMGALGLLGNNLHFQLQG
jgi:glutaryl-CoA dehydrogenase